MPVPPQFVQNTKKGAPAPTNKKRRLKANVKVKKKGGKPAPAPTKEAAMDAIKKRAARY